MSNEKIKIKGPDRLFIAFLEEWNGRHMDGLALSPELLEMIERHLSWARCMGAEAVIHKLQRTLELTPHTDFKVSYRFLMELIRTTSPINSDDYLINTPRKYEININAETVINSQTRILKP